MKRKTKVTMNDIARAAGVSQATVSLVLNQSRNIKLSDDTRQRVINVATELGYDRLPAVHAPRNQEEIALLVSSMQSFDPFIDAISQAREAAWRNETLLTVYDYGDDIELALNIIRQLEKRNCIGIIPRVSGHHAGGHDGVSRTAPASRWCCSTSATPARRCCRRLSRTTTPTPSR
jgi:LacI family transcriptional regulator